MRNRRLVLKRDVLTELDATELTNVVGGAATYEFVNCDVYLTRQAACDSLLRPCISSTCTR
jgi:hypothetical protein